LGGAIAEGTYGPDAAFSAKGAKAEPQSEMTTASRDNSDRKLFKIKNLIQSRHVFEFLCPNSPVLAGVPPNYPNVNDLTACDSLLGRFAVQANFLSYFGENT
jgi:hypothetical protein